MRLFFLKEGYPCKSVHFIEGFPYWGGGGLSKRGVLIRMFLLKRCSYGVVLFKEGCPYEGSFLKKGYPYGGVSFKEECPYESSFL